MNTPSLLDAVRIARENEKVAMESYANAAKEVGNIGAELFIQLSEFEKYHYEQLTVLIKSLEESGRYIDYKGKEFPLPPVFDIKTSQEPNKKSVMQIITEALELEKLAEKTYVDLSESIEDEEGWAMFARLAKEEHKHFLILSKAYWSINNTGFWKW